jgi:signal transduction histidine kinase
MSAGSLARQEVTVVKEIADLPLLSLDRHRVLLILVNLISNAKQALDGVLDRSPSITFGASLAEGPVLRITVADNGNGITPEHLARIFSHGFTTRQDGHGFGLHSCALAAQEMGGSLTVHSDGAGQGATFTLDIPLDACAAQAMNTEPAHPIGRR